MFAGTLLQVLQTSFLSSCLSFPSSVIAADGRQLEDLACFSTCWAWGVGGVLLVEHNAGSTLLLLLLSPVTPRSGKSFT